MIKLSSEMKCQYSGDLLLTHPENQIFVDLFTLKVMSSAHERLIREKSKNGENQNPLFKIEISSPLSDDCVLNKAIIYSKDNISVNFLERSPAPEWNKECELCEKMVKVRNSET